jgi:hypothetical protein
VAVGIAATHDHQHTVAGHKHSSNTHDNQLLLLTPNRYDCLLSLVLLLHVVLLLLLLHLLLVGIAAHSGRHLLHLGCYVLACAAAVPLTVRAGWGLSRTL